LSALRAAEELFDYRAPTPVEVVEKIDWAIHASDGGLNLSFDNRGGETIIVRVAIDGAADWLDLSVDAPSRHRWHQRTLILPPYNPVRSRHRGSPPSPPPCGVGKGRRSKVLQSACWNLRY
jgi:hypothetical protein